MAAHANSYTVNIPDGIAHVYCAHTSNTLLNKKSNPEYEQAK